MAGAQAPVSVFRSGLLSGRGALVTGGGTGIGYAIARELLELGCNVVIASRKEPLLQAACERLRADPGARGRVEYVVCDVRKEEQVETMVDLALEKLGRLDFLVNNAGGQYPAPAAGITNKGWRSVVDLNLNGTFSVCRAVYDKWMFDHGGSIVNVVCNYFWGFPLMAHTGAARAAVANLTHTLALEWASCGIRVNAVAPGVIFSTSAKQHYDANQGLLGDDALSQQTPTIPARRLGSVEEVATAVTFLLQPSAAYITGHVLRVDGGQPLQGQGAWTAPDAQNYPVWGEVPSKDEAASKL